MKVTQSSDSLRPHGLYSPWNSPGQNTGVGSFSLLQGIFPTQGLNPGLPNYTWILYQLSHKGRPLKNSSLHVESESCSVVSDSLWSHGLYSPWNSPGQNTGVGSLSLLQGIFSTQGSNPGLLHCRQVLYQLSYKVSPRILEWVTYYFSSRSSWPRNRTGVSCTAGGFFTSWAMREALGKGKEAHGWGLGEW